MGGMPGLWETQPAFQGSTQLSLLQESLLKILVAPYTLSCHHMNLFLWYLSPNLDYN